MSHRCTIILTSLPQHNQAVGRIAAQFLDTRLEEAQAVAQFLRRRAQGGVDIARREPVDRQRMDELDRHGFVGRAGESLLDARLEHHAAINDRLDAWARPENAEARRRTMREFRRVSDALRWEIRRMETTKLERVREVLAKTHQEILDILGE